MDRRRRTGYVSDASGHSGGQGSLPRRSGEANPVGPFGEGGRWRRKKRVLTDPHVTCGEKHGHHGRCTQGGRAARMADRAIGIHAPQGLCAVIVFDVVFSVMLMVMVPDVLGRCARLVLAIHAHRRPTELQREKRQQKYGEPAAHARHSSGKGDGPTQPPGIQGAAWVSQRDGLHGRERRFGSSDAVRPC